MKSIAFFTYSFVVKGGIERVIKLKIDALIDNYKCNLILLYGNGEFSYKLNKIINVFCLNNEYYHIRKILIKNLILLKNIIKKNNIKILILEGRSSVLIPMLLKILLNFKIIFCDHESLYGYKLRSRRKNLKERICNSIDQFLIIKLSDKIVTLTEKEKIEYLNLFHVSEVKVENIYNIVDPKLFCNVKNYSLNSKKIISVGRIDYQKGYEYLIEVAKFVFSKYPDWQWHIYGDGEAEYKNQIIDLIQQNNLQKHIILQGNRSDIYDLYQNYSFYVMTSRYEGLPMVLLEAKAKKLPIVSFDINSGPSDIIRDGIDGFLIKPFDCQMMAEKICELIENPELRQKFSDNAHGNIDKFSKEKIIKQWCDLIDELS